MCQFGMYFAELKLCVVTTNRTNLNFAMGGIAVDNANCSYESAVDKS